MIWGNLMKIVKKSIELYQEHLMTFIALGVIFGCINVISLSFLAVFAQKSPFVFIVFNLLLTSIATIATIEASSRSLFGKVVDLKEIFQGVGKKYVTFVMVSSVVLMLSSIGAMVFVIPGLLCVTFFIFADVIVVCENVDVKEVLSQSIELVKPRFWMVLLFNLVLFTSMLFLLLLVKYVFVNVPLFNKIANVLFMVVVPPFYNLVKVVFYYGCKSDEFSVGSATSES